MSKLYKSGQCVEADPCRLEPADVEAFFINDGFRGKADLDPSSGTDGQSGATEPVDSSEKTDVSQNTTGFGEEKVFTEVASSTELDADTEIDESAAMASSVNEEAAARAEITGPETDSPKSELEKLFDVAGHIRSLLEAGHQSPDLDSGKKESKFEPFGSSPEVKKGTPKAFNPPKYRTDKAASNVEAEGSIGVEPGVSTDGQPVTEEDAGAEASREKAKLVFAEAQKEAGELTEKAKNQAESLLSQAQLQVKQRLEGVEDQAGSILSGARSQAGQITNGASQQAQALLRDAEQQAESIVESSKQKVLLLIENAKKEAEKITGAAEQKVAELTGAAKKEADDLLAAATEESIRMKNQAQQEGLETGRQEGMAQLRKELEQNLATALALINQSEEERLTRIRSSEPELLKLALGIAEKIMGAELQLNPAAMLEITREALTRVATANNILIRVNLEELTLFTEHSAILQKAFTEPKMIRIEADPGITPGNCFIETEHGNIDPRIKSQLEVIWTELVKAGAIS